MSAEKIRLVLVDDHQIVLEGLVRLFQATEGFEVAARCTSGRDAVEAVRRERPDVLILDLGLPDLDGLAVLRQLSAMDVSVRAVLLTASLTPAQSLAVSAARVQGVVLKDMAPRLLIECVRRVHAGERWVERRSMGVALDLAVQRREGLEAAQQLLTRRELEVATEVARGGRNREIADRLGISEGTVKVHLANIFEKLKLESRVDLVRWILDRGLG